MLLFSEQHVKWLWYQMHGCQATILPLKYESCAHWELWSNSLVFHMDYLLKHVIKCGDLWHSHSDGFKSHYMLSFFTSKCTNNMQHLTLHNPCFPYIHDILSSPAGICKCLHVYAWIYLTVLSGRSQQPLTPLGITIRDKPRISMSSIVNTQIHTKDANIFFKILIIDTT